MIRLPLATNSYPAASRPLSIQRLINFYTETEPVDAKSKLAIYQRPGLRLWKDFLSSDGIRFLHLMGGSLYVVIGVNVYRLDSGGNATLLGTVFSTTGSVYGANNGTQLAIVTASDGRGYVATSTTFGPITDPDFLGAAAVAYIDGYMAFIKPNTDVWFISNLNDAFNYDGFDAATAESQPDGLIGMVSDNRALWLFGETSVEVWYDSGDPDFPFDRISGAVIEYGCAAGGSINQADNAVLWLANDLTVRIARGYTSAERISNHGMEAAIQGYSTVSDAQSFVFTQRGHTFYVLRFPMANACWVLDLSTNSWLEWQSGVSGNAFNVCGYANAFGLDLVGDASSGKIYVLDPNTYSDNGETIIRAAVSPPYQADTLRSIMDSFELDMGVGVGLTTGQGSNPKAMLECSDDGGYTFGNQRVKEIGPIGTYNTRVRFTRMGAFRQRSIKVSFSDPVNIAIYAAAVNIRPLQT